MKKKRIKSIFIALFITQLFGQWEQSTGTDGLDMQAVTSYDNTIFAGGQIGTGVFRSTDFGNTWELLSNGITSSAYRCFAHNNDLIVAGSTSAGVFYSVNDGDSWSEINEGLTDLGIFDLSLSGSHIIAATPNQGVFRYSLSNMSLSANENTTVPHTFDLHQNYPNPFNPITTIQYDIPERVQVQIIIYNMVGHEIKSLLNEYQNPGLNSVKWDATNNHGKTVSAGLYIYKISVGNYQKSRKMVLLK
jgi:hypothetical protein